MGNSGATKRQHGPGGWEREKSTKGDGQVGYWTYEQVVKMDNRALARLISVHPELCPRRIRESIKRYAHVPKALSVPLASVPEPPDDETAEDFLGRLFGDDGSAIPGQESPEQTRRAYVETAKAIKQAIANKYSMTLADLDCDSRSHALVFARHEAIYLIAKHTTLNYVRIGRMFGGRDHSTIYSSIRAHSKRNGLPMIRDNVSKTVSNEENGSNSLVSTG